MKHFRKTSIAVLLIAVLLVGSLAGCQALRAEGEIAAEGQGPTPTPTPIPIDANIPRDGRLTIRFAPGSSLNPYTTTNSDNLAASGLIYEGLYALDEQFTAVSVLAQNLTTLDGRRFLLELRDDVTFHNGAPLTVTDVIYSLNVARNSNLYGGRLRIIEGYARQTDEEGEVLAHEMEITLNRVHGNLPVLLTFPIIPSGSSGWTVPPGTGPFLYPDDGNPRIMAFDDHRMRADLPIDTIYLSEINSMEQMTIHFNEGLLDIVFIDPIGSGEPRLAASREVRHFEASLLDYVGFNVNRPETGRLEVRQAISRAINRAYITDNIMRGNAVASTLPLHPTLPYFDNLLARQHAFDLELALEILAGESTIGRPAEPDAYEDEEAPIAPVPPPETAENGYADYENAEEEEADDQPVQLTLLVMDGNTMRMEVATYIASNIAALGYRVVVIDLPHDDFIAALADGNFDLFYGQVRLQPDFDLTHILTGDLAFGGIGRLMDQRIIDDFVASGHAGRAQAATAMGAAIFAEVPIITIGFRHLAVATQRGVVAGMRPTQDNIYHNVWDWIVDV